MRASAIKLRSRSVIEREKDLELILAVRQHQPFIAEPYLNVTGLCIISFRRRGLNLQGGIAFYRRLIPFAPSRRNDHYGAEKKRPLKPTGFAFSAAQRG